MSNELNTVKEILQQSLSARSFVDQVSSRGFNIEGEDSMGVSITGSHSKMILTVLASKGPDLIWTLAFKDGDKPASSLVDEGKLLF